MQFKQCEGVEKKEKVTREKPLNYSPHVINMTKFQTTKKARLLWPYLHTPCHCSCIIRLGSTSFVPSELDHTNHPNLWRLEQIVLRQSDHQEVSVQRTPTCPPFSFAWHTTDVFQAVVSCFGACLPHMQCYEHPEQGCFSCSSCWMISGAVLEAE